MSDEIDVLDDNHINQYEMHLHTLHADSAVVEHSLKKCPMWNSIIDAIDRLRARNEALERVAKAAAKLDEWDIGKFMTCEDCGHTDQDAKEIDTAYCAMSAALSALNPSETPNSSGGET